MNDVTFLRDCKCTLEQHIQRTSNDKWNITVENYFNFYLNFCRTKYDNHNSAARYFRRIDRMLIFPAVSVTVLTTVLAGLQSKSASFDPLSVALLTLSSISTGLQSIRGIFEYKTRANLHIQSAGRYFELVHRIEDQMILRPEDRFSPDILLEIIGDPLDSLVTSEPMIPGRIDKTKLKDSLEPLL